MKWYLNNPLPYSFFPVGLETTLIFFVSPHALLDSLRDAGEVLGADRRCCLAREITKSHEEFWRSSLGEAWEEFNERGPRGEFTMVIEGCRKAVNGDVPATDDEIITALNEACRSGISPSQAAKDVASAFDVPKKRAYILSLQLNK